MCECGSRYRWIYPSFTGYRICRKTGKFVGYCDGEPIKDHWRLRESLKDLAKPQP